MTLKFDANKERVLDTIIESESSKFILDGNTYNLVEIDNDDLPFAKLIFNRIFTIMLSITGNVEFYKIEPPLFPRSTLLIRVRVYGPKIYIVKLERDDRDLSFICKSVEHIVYCLVNYDRMKIMKNITGVPYEEDIINAILAASRIAKSLTNVCVPVIDIETGKIIDYEPVNAEETIFIEVFRALLREYDRKRWGEE